MVGVMSTEPSIVIYLFIYLFTAYAQLDPPSSILPRDPTCTVDLVNAMHASRPPSSIELCL